MDIVEYMVSVVIIMTIVIVVGEKFLHPIVSVNNKKIVYIILIILGLAWGVVVDIFESPILYGGVFGMFAGVIHLMVDYKKE